MLTVDLGIYDVLNLGFLCGWGVVLQQLLCIAVVDPSCNTSPFQHSVSPWLDNIFAPFSPAGTSALWLLVFGLEIGCCIDVLRMLLGALRGNLVLGFCLHATRIFMLWTVLPVGEPGDKRHSVTFVVLITYAVTELTR